jgi:ATP-dependent RNA helicase DeaD
MSSAKDFADLGLRAELVAACRSKGFRTAMPIQTQAIPALLGGQDALIQAKTGSGKTLSYGLPMLQTEPSQAERPEGLVITPTRELAGQVAGELSWAGAAVGRTVQLIAGGGRTEKQQTQLAKGCNIVVGTAGRLLDLVRRGGLHLNKVRFLVLDEADELLQRGFGEDLDALADLLPADRQTVLCSATIPVEVETLAKRFMRRPQRIGGTAGKELPAEVTHRVVFTTIDERTDDLIAWLKLERPYQALIFTGSRSEADELTPALQSAELDAETFHGDLSAVRRRQLIERFRSGDLAILVATDIAARGLDLPGVTHVVNHSLPKGIGPYVHRTGRTGRAGKTGMAVSLVIPQETDRLERLRAAFAFEAVTVRGPKAGEVRPLRTEKMKQSRQERRGLTKRWAAEAEVKAEKRAKAAAAAKARKEAERAERAAAEGKSITGKVERTGKPVGPAKSAPTGKPQGKSAGQVIGKPKSGPGQAKAGGSGKTAGKVQGPAKAAGFGKRDDRPQPQGRPTKAHGDARPDARGQGGNRPKGGSQERRTEGGKGSGSGRRR